MADGGHEIYSAVEHRRRFLEDSRLEARDALAAIVSAYDALTDYERMVMPERFRIAIEKGRDK